MAISKDNTRVILTISKELREKLEQSAKEDKRTVSKQVEFLLENYFNK